ncbi:MAG: hypothetical protein ACM3SR_15350 [Ignavibacteriales bacterium]
MKKLDSIVYLACILLAFLVIRGAQAQNMQEVQPIPGHIAGPVVLNNGIVWPLENLDSFQDSTLDPTTLGKRIEQRSNIELNEPKGNRSEVRGPEVTERTSQTQMERESEPNFVPLSPPMRTPIYVWTDKKRTTHFTNLIKSVPLEFRDQAIKRAEKLQKEAQITF